jgi:LuxR family maltose regulon positive regulatory protein
MLNTGNTSLLSVIEALQAELALRQGRVSVAWQWADRFVTAPPLRPEFRFLAPHLTLAKVWLADDTAAGQARAAGLLAQLRTFFESTHNSRFLIEVLALQALQQRAPGQLVTDALAHLERALALAQPGGFVRLFVDLGSGMARLLADLRSADGERTEYIDQILAAFPSSSRRAHRSDGKQAFLTAATSMARSMVEPLTNRELEVLALLSEGLSDQELAQRLVISPHTVRTHLKHIFAKLEVGNRREAVVRADQLGLLSSG